MAGEWAHLTLKDAGVALIDCDHRTPKEVVAGYPYVTIPQMKDGEIELASARKISPVDYAEWTKKARPQEHDVLLSRRCNPGETSAVRKATEFAVGQNLVLLRANGHSVTPSFLRWIVRSPVWWEQVEKYRNPGAVFDSLKCRDIIRFELPIPPLDVQERIAELLGSLDDKIELNRRMAATLEEMARSLFKSWFVDFDPVRAKVEGRDPGLSPATATLFPETFGEDGLPVGWTMKNVADGCLAIFSGGTPSTSEPDFWNGTLPWFSSGETRHRFVTDTEKKITQQAVDNSSTRLARRGSTVIASAGQGNTRGQTSFLLLDTHINQSVVVLQADASVASDLFLFFNLERRYDEFRRVSDGQSSRGSLTTKLLGGLPALCPDRKVVAAFDAVAQPLVDRIERVLAETEGLKALRDTLLPKLISGELRISSTGNSEVEVA